MNKRIIAAIEEADYDTVEELIVKLPVSPVENFTKLCLNILMSLDDGETFTYIVDILERINPYDQVHVLNLIITFTSNIDLTRSMKYYMPEITHISFIDEWITYDGSYFDNIGVACDLYLTVYGPINDETMKAMLEDIKKRSKFDFYDVMFGFYTRTSGFAERPSWIDLRPTNDEELEMKMEELGHVEINKDDLVDIVFNELDGYIAESRNEILGILDNLDEAGQNTVQGIVASDDMTSFFGPSNPFPLSMYDPIQERMLLCNVYDADEEGEDYDWFGGACEVCGMRIKHRHYALRMPELSGGWSGCYCSWKCVTSRANDEEGVLLVKIKDELEKKPIFDRQ